MSCDKDKAADKIQIVDIVDKEGITLFAKGDSYEIPIYQRAFAWGTEMANDINHVDEVCQLMDDVCEFDGDTYYIGSMVVDKINDKVYEVIDGQQRLTALFIILSCLKWQIEEENIESDYNKLELEPTLNYSERKNSERAIEHLYAVIKTLKGRKDDHDQITLPNNENGGQWQTNKGECLESSICDAVHRVFAKFDLEGVDYQKRLLQGLAKVVLYRIEVPVDTDLNLYFEIMNVRGEQLEQSDIVKARLMQVLDNDNQREWFAKTWNACYDMTGYVQMNFSNENSERDILFGGDWSELPCPERFYDLIGKNTGGKEQGNENIGNEKNTMLSAILEPNAGTEFGRREQDVDLDENSRFHSVIYFQHFLLHVLRIYKKSCNGGELEIGRQLNEKALADEFENALQEVEKEKQSSWAWDFMICLLECRCLFDRYFIKRDYSDNADYGEWSIMSLKKYKESWEYQETNGKGKENKRCLMIESCLRVTYTDHKTMHWITKVLDWIYRECKDGRNPVMSAVANECETFVKEKVIADLTSLKANSYRMGTGTPHLLFNYLDYLLWKGDEYERDEKVEFAFKYRNSVEHWYPQHPTTIDAWDDAIGNGRLDRDGFGNLCLMDPRDNSRFCNLPPASKATYKPELNENGSLKYQLMAKAIRQLNNNVKDVDEYWKEASFIHGEEMLSKLAAGVGGFNLELEKYEWKKYQKVKKGNDEESEKVPTEF